MAKEFGYAWHTEVTIEGFEWEQLYAGCHGDEEAAAVGVHPLSTRELLAVVAAIPINKCMDSTILDGSILVAIV
jgi:hypothetical protein